MGDKKREILIPTPSKSVINQQFYSQIKANQKEKELSHTRNKSLTINKVRYPKKVLNNRSKKYKSQEQQPRKFASNYLKNTKIADLLRSYKSKTTKKQSQPNTIKKKELIQPQGFSLSGKLSVKFAKKVNNFFQNSKNLADFSENQQIQPEESIQISKSQVFPQKIKPHVIQTTPQKVRVTTRKKNQKATWVQ